jgi:hypothetical protein
LRRLTSHWIFWSAAGVGCTLIAVWAICRRDQPVLALGPFAVLWALAAVRYPRLGLAVWFVGLCVTPHWLNIHAGGTWPPGSLLGLTVLPAALWHLRMRVHVGDVLVVGAIGAAVVAYRYGGTPQAQLFAMVVQGLIPYLIARGLVPVAGLAWTVRLLALTCTGLAVWSIAEEVASWHPFVGLDGGSTEAFWSQIQYRGGRARSEAAFGHAIVLGGAIAAGVPFILASTWRTTWKGIALVLAGFGILATGSRGPMIAALLGLALTLLFYAGGDLRPTARLGLAALSAAVGFGLVQLLASLVTNAGTEAELSADYRNELYSHIASDARPFSVARNLQFDPTGAQTWRGQFGSVDSSFIQYTLVFGFVAVLLLLAVAAIGIVRVLTRRASIVEIAAISQLPVLATVALITQYYLFTWFLLGAAVALTGSTARSRAPSPQRPRPAPLRAARPAAEPG